MDFRSLGAAIPVVVLLGVTGCGGKSTSPRDQVDQVVRTFLSATGREQWQTACDVLTKQQQAALVAGAKQGLLTQSATDCASALADAASASVLPATARRQAADRALSSLRFSATHVAGARATATFSVLDSSNQRESDTVDLVQQDGRWKIASGAA